MKKKLLYSLLAVGASTVGALIYMLRNKQKCVDEFYEHLTIFELDHQYPNCECLADQIKEHVARLNAVGVDTLFVTSIHCVGDSDVHMTICGDAHVYNVDYYIDDSEFFCSEYLRTSHTEEDPL